MAEITERDLEYFSALLTEEKLNLFNKLSAEQKATLLSNIPVETIELMLEEANNTEKDDIFASLSSETLIEIDFFELSAEDRIRLFNKLSIEERKKLLANIPIGSIELMLNTCSTVEKVYIYEALSKEMLKAVYNRASYEEQENMRGILDNYKAVIADSQNQIHSRLNNLNQSLERTTTTIDDNKNKIAEDRKAIRQAKLDRALAKITLKKLSFEQDLAVRQILRRQNKLSPDRWSNKIAVVSNRRTRKLREALAKSDLIAKSYQETQTNITQANNDIINLNNDINHAKDVINDAREDRDAVRAAISQNAEELKANKVKLKGITKKEKHLFGKKLFGRILKKQDCVVVRKKSRAVTQTSTIASVQHINTTVDALNQVGIVCYQPTTALNPAIATNLPAIPTTTISTQQEIIALYALMAKCYQKIQELQVQQGQGHSRGNVNILLLASIIFFIIGFLFFIFR